MEVRLKIGRYAGEIRDVVNDAAHEMIADGRAEDTRFDEFANGGLVSNASPVMVGESVQDCFIPRAVAEKIEAQSPALRPKKRRS